LLLSLGYKGHHNHQYTRQHDHPKDACGKTQEVRVLDCNIGSGILTKETTKKTENPNCKTKLAEISQGIPGFVLENIAFVEFGKDQLKGTSNCSDRAGGPYDSKEQRLPNTVERPFTLLRANERTQATANTDREKKK
jgi:hypothetical protein